MQARSRRAGRTPLRLGLRSCVFALALLWTSAAAALECGTNNGYVCTGGAPTQYAGGFDPRTGYGGFGGGACTASRTPVVFIHGNGDSAISFDMPPGVVSGYARPARSPYGELRAAGYNDCELFGVTYLSEVERAHPQYNYHEPYTYRMLEDFIDAVKAYTGKPQVDIVAHSLGSTMALAMLKYTGSQGSVRRFVNIGGAIRGLQTCRHTGYQNPLAQTCNAEGWVYPYNHTTFGLYPSTGVAGYGYNRWTGSGSGSLRGLPASWPGIRFYTITAGLHDQVHCFSTSNAATCPAGALFNARSNVIAQVDVGLGSTAYRYDWNWADGMPVNAGGGDNSSGVGHFRSLANTGVVLRNMLTTACTTNCGSGYAGVHGPLSHL